MIDFIDKLLAKSRVRISEEHAQSRCSKPSDELSLGREVERPEFLYNTDEEDWEDEEDWDDGVEPEDCEEVGEAEDYDFLSEDQIPY